MAHRHGARVLVDGAQAVSHMPVDVQALDCDFYVFSGHKVFAPTGIGAVYGKPEVLDAMPPWQGGGNMIRNVTFEHTAYQPPPARFEAGTGNIADAVGLGAALRLRGPASAGRTSPATSTSCSCYAIAGAGRRARAAADRHRAGQGRRPVVRARRVPDRGRRVGARPGGHRRPRWAPLRPAGPAPLRARAPPCVPSLALYNTYPEVDALAAVLHRLAAQRARV